MAGQGNLAWDDPKARNDLSDVPLERNAIDGFQDEGSDIAEWARDLDGSHELASSSNRNNRNHWVSNLLIVSLLIIAIVCVGLAVGFWVNPQTPNSTSKTIYVPVPVTSPTLPPVLPKDNTAPSEPQTIEYAKPPTPKVISQPPESAQPSISPTKSPTKSPTESPTKSPTKSPTAASTTSQPIENSVGTPVQAQCNADIVLSHIPDPEDPYVLIDYYEQNVGYHADQMFISHGEEECSATNATLLWCAVTGDKAVKSRRNGAITNSDVPFDNEDVNQTAKLQIDATRKSTFRILVSRVPNLEFENYYDTKNHNATDHLWIGEVTVTINGSGESKTLGPAAPNYLTLGDTGYYKEGNNYVDDEYSSDFTIDMTCEVGCVCTLGEPTYVTPAPTVSPMESKSEATPAPTVPPTKKPTIAPTKSPTKKPTIASTEAPTKKPTVAAAVQCSANIALFIPYGDYYDYYWDIGYREEQMIITESQQQCSAASTNPSWCQMIGDKALRSRHAGHYPDTIPFGNEDQIQTAKLEIDATRKSTFQILVSRIPNDHEAYYDSVNHNATDYTWVGAVTATINGQEVGSVIPDVYYMEETGYYLGDYYYYGNHDSDYIVDLTCEVGCVCSLGEMKWVSDGITT